MLLAAMGIVAEVEDGSEGCCTKVCGIHRIKHGRVRYESGEFDILYK